MNYIIRKSRRRAVTMRFDSDGTLIISCPIFYGRKEIESFINEKQEWIRKNYSIVCSRKIELETNFTDSYILFFGKRTKVVLQSKSLYLDKLTNTLYLPNSNFVKSISQFALDYIRERVQVLSEIINVNFAKIKLINAKNKWGSCRHDRTLSFNWRIIFLPKNLQDYIIIHELCHIKQMNHSKKFWNEVELFCKEYRLLKNQLRLEYAYIMDTYRK